jgi:hypothetical protein
MVLECGQPEFGDTLNIGLIARLVDLLNSGLLIILVRVRYIADSFTGSDFFFGRLGLSGDNLLSAGV